MQHASLSRLELLYPSCFFFPICGVSVFGTIDLANIIDRENSWLFAQSFGNPLSFNHDGIHS